MRKFSIALFVGLFCIVSNVHAVIISGNGYSHDTSTNYVVGGGLKWLQWGETAGMSINQALAAHSGWRLATNAEMAALFNAFQFGQAPGYWDSNENTAQSVSTGTDGAASEPADDPELLFVSIFGQTYFDYTFDDYTTDFNYYRFAGARFGEDGDEDNLFNQAFVYDDYSYCPTFGCTAQQLPGQAAIYSDGTSPSLASGAYGVALVQSVAPVPEPATWALMGVGLLGLVGFQRRQRSQRA